MYRFITYIITLFLNLSAFSQLDQSHDLYKLIKSKDSLLFEIGYNKCNINQIEKHLSNSFHFFHDQAGIIESKEEFIKSVNYGLCNLPYKAIRSLDKKSFEVYPLENDNELYGAIEIGSHKFYAIENNNQKFLTSIAKFTHVWIIENNKWKLKSVLSYDHRDFSKKENEDGLFTEQEITNQWLKNKKIAALGIGYIENGQIIQTSVFGELRNGQKAPLNTIWNVASLTKPITALVTLKLINAGLWSLDDPISNYYVDPDVKDDSRIKLLTTRVILSHQSGFPNWRRSSLNGKLEFEFEPGSRYQYSGEGYEYLRKALEAKFDKSLEQLAQELVFTPLSMDNTSFVWNKEIDSKPFAKWHTSDGILYETAKFYKANAADNLLTTVEDYSKFMLHILNKANLSDSLYRNMITNHVQVSSFKHFGLGWWADNNINENRDFALVHGGDDVGVHCIVFLLPNSQKGLLIFTNSDNGTDAYMGVLNHFLEKDAPGIIKAEMN